MVPSFIKINNDKL